MVIMLTIIMDSMAITTRIMITLGKDLHVLHNRKNKLAS